MRSKERCKSTIPCFNLTNCAFPPERARARTRERTRSTNFLPFHPKQSSMLDYEKRGVYRMALELDITTIKIHDRLPREARQNLSLDHVNVLVHLHVNVPEIKTSRGSGTCTFTSTRTSTSAYHRVVPTRKPDEP